MVGKSGLLQQGKQSRRSFVAATAGIAGVAGTGAVAAQTPMASPEASPSASPVPGYPLDIVHELDLVDHGTPRRGGTVRLPVRSANLTTFVPPLQQQDPLVAWSYLDPLVRIDPQSMEPRPGLAERWEWSADGLSLSFELRTGVTWHDGTPFTAADAIFTHVAYRDDYQSVIAGQSGLVTNIVGDGDDVLVVEFAAPDGAWLYNVASLPIMQRAQYLDWWERNAVGERTLAEMPFANELPFGTGPWRIEGIGVSGVSLGRNDAYFDEPPHADRLELIAVDNVAQGIELWRSGELDVVAGIAPSDVDQLLNDEGRLIVVNAARSVFGAFNFDNPGRPNPAMLADPLVREATNLALNRARFAEDAYADFLRWEHTGVVAQPWAHESSLRNPEQDLERARALLAEAGWADTTGFGVLYSPAGDSLVLTALVLDSAGPEVIRMLELANEELRKIGGGIAIEVLPRERFIERWQVERTWDLLVYDLRVYPAFAEFDLFGTAWDTRINPMGWNPGGYSNPDANAAINAWFEAVDQPDMVAALDVLQQSVNEDLFGLWFGFPQDLVLLSNDIRGFRPNRLLTAGDTRLLWKDSSV